MKFRNLITAAAIAALPLAAQAATLVIPAAGTGPGANGSQWQSELTLHTSAPRAVSLTLSYHQGTTVLGPVALTLQARETVSIDDVVKTKFGVESGSGALVVEAADRDARSLAVNSRTFNTSAEGEFGQDIPAVDVANASRLGDVTALTGPSSAAGSRFNFGVYAVEAADVTWELVRANGTVAATAEVAYAAGQHAQYNNGVESLLGATPNDDDTVHARITTGKAVFYGSVVNGTGDPTFVPGVRTRDDVIITFVGIDLDEDGAADVFDEDGDGVLDSRIDVPASLGFPSYFRVIAKGEFDETISYEVVSSPAQTDVLDTVGTLRVSPAGDVKGQNGEIVVKAKTGTTESLITIPVFFR